MQRTGSNRLLAGGLLMAALMLAGCDGPADTEAPTAVEPDVEVNPQPTDLDLYEENEPGPLATEPPRPPTGEPPAEETQEREETVTTPADNAPVE